jgi:hypothetical protein
MIKPGIRRWRKRLKSIGPYRITDAGWRAVVLWLSDGWYASIDLSSSAKDIDDRLRHLRFEYERFTFHADAIGLNAKERKEVSWLINHTPRA